MSEHTVDIKERRVMIVPVGLEKDRIVEGCTAYPINVLYLINNPKKIKNKKAVYEYSLIFSKAILDKFNNSHICIFQEEAPLNSFIGCTSALNRIFVKEKQQKNLSHIYINVATASKSFALAAYVFALFHPDLVTVFYLKTSEYIILDYLEKEPGNNGSLKQLKEEFLASGLTKGPYKIDEIPLFPIIHFSTKQIELIKCLASQEKFDSINGLIEKLPSGLKSENRVQIRRLLRSLEEKGLISVEKDENDARNRIIRVSKILNNLTKILS
ncbi:hypothetical protein ES708_15693 [subsurface metagenome]